ncbi:amidohydrolase [Mycobacteroides abscessus subsp. abscessus]|jgi:RecA/RadA recombinase|uniref:amidohydrolase n=1 Tax=Mycobacteroides abscessus TaxID=36809 RepID=UPI00266CC807|nr:amidohydrolase [Mycobacteroides abscessus]MDO3013301.1 amidohydrolase [Mycobacteroides abscessus subsp. abscessus]
MITRSTSLTPVSERDHQAAAHASAPVHHPGQSVRAAAAWIDTMHARAQRRAERHPRSHRAA